MSHHCINGIQVTLTQICMMEREKRCLVALMEKKPPQQNRAEPQTIYTITMMKFFSARPQWRTTMDLWGQTCKPSSGECRLLSLICSYPVIQMFNENTSPVQYNTIYRNEDHFRKLRYDGVLVVAIIDICIATQVTIISIAHSLWSFIRSRYSSYSVLRLLFYMDREVIQRIQPLATCLWTIQLGIYNHSVLFDFMICHDNLLCIFS